MITKDKFNEMWDSYLVICDNEVLTGFSSEYGQYSTQFEVAQNVKEHMSDFLFVEQDAKEARRAKYEELKKEFGE